MSETRNRKIEHIDIVLSRRVRGPRTTWLEYVHLIHNPAPEIDFEEIDISTEFLGKRLSAPIIITGMTGGHPKTLEINASLAEIAERYGIGMGVGSQRAALEDPSLARTFSIVREKAPKTLIIANLGAAQIIGGYGLDKIMRAIEMLDADAIAIHLNPAQESIQPEGEPSYRGLVKKIEELVKSLNKPVMIKETGCGLSMESVGVLRRAGVRYFDVSGSGGTNWILVEMYRAEMKGDRLKKYLAEDLSEWGIPTAASVIETRYSAPDSFIIGSGGLRNGVDIAKVIALGADIGGMAYPFLEAYFSRDIDFFVRRVIHEIRAVLFLTGSRNLREFIHQPIVIRGSLRTWMKERSIRRDIYENIRKTRRDYNARRGVI
ncbi:MAG: type 2 isopentenyl-diphosphate Delta-isomerase [Sulfolobales archaeon]